MHSDSIDKKKIIIFSVYINVLFLFRVHVEMGTMEVTSQLLEKKVSSDIFDFDNHLDDISCDWSNRQISRLIRSLVAANEI